MRSEREAEPISVAIVTADPLVRAALAASVEQHAELELVAELDQADVVLWDPGLGPGEERYRAPAASGPPVVVLASDPEQAAAALAAGARGVLARDVDHAALAAALIALARGLSVLDESTRARLWPEAAADAEPALANEQLTARELEVVQLLAAGLSNKAIARRLDISEHTAKFHVNSILAKLGAGSRTEAVVAAARRGLVIL
jgi:DNA-binding NarL/FixJ family response regulator